MRKITKRKFFGILFLFGLVVWLSSSAFVAWRLTRRSSPPCAESLPKIAWPKVEEHRLTTSDHEQIGEWLVRGKPEKGCILALHGNGGSRGSMLPVMEQPYKDLQSAVWTRLQNRLPPGLDCAAYAGLRLWAPVFLPVEVDRLSPAKHVADIPTATPIVILAGSADQHARLDDVKILYETVQPHAELVIFEGAPHVSLDRQNPELYRNTLFKFLTAP